MKKTILTLTLATSLIVAANANTNTTNPAGETETTVSTKVITVGSSRQVTFILKDGRKVVYNVNYGTSNILNAYLFTGSKIIKSNVEIQARIYSANGQNYQPLNINTNYFLTQKVATLLNIDLAH